MPVVDFDRYRLRLNLECPLVGVQGRQHRAFDQYTAELVRDDGTVCAVIEVYFVRVDDPRAQHAHAAAEIGSEFLAKVCREALDLRGGVREYIEAEFMDAMTDVFVLERIAVLEPDGDRPVLQGMFVQALFSTLSRGMDIVFIDAGPSELSFWKDTVGARQVGDFIAASGARRLPVYPKSPSAVSPRAALPHLQHGGPGRAGGGAELGGTIGMMPYLQRSAIQASSWSSRRLAPPTAAGRTQCSTMARMRRSAGW